MKKLFTSLSALLLVVPSLPVQANNYSQPGGTRQESCYTTVYREEYIPGTRNSPGRVRSWTERKEVPCEEPQTTPGYLPADPAPTPAPYREYRDDNSCIEGTILGGLAGGAAGAGLSRDEGMIVGIPLGIVAGALIGCQLDGG